MLRALTVQSGWRQSDGSSIIQHESWVRMGMQETMNEHITEANHVASEMQMASCMTQRLYACVRV